MQLQVTTLVMKLSTLTSSFPAWYPTAMEQVGMAHNIDPMPSECA